MDNFSNTLNLSKAVVSSKNGVCSAQHKIAAGVGADVLNAGGNAVDAAVAMSFVIGVVEPWMSGIGGGGYMAIKFKSDAPKALEYGMKSPKKINFADYKIDTTAGAVKSPFAWAPVVNAHNQIGGGAVAVPGLVKGMALAHQQLGTMSWRDLLQPAIEVAKSGFEIDFYTQFLISTHRDKLQKFAKTKQIFLPPNGSTTASSFLGSDKSDILTMPDLADTLDCIARDGESAFYEGDIANDIIASVTDQGGYLSADDLKSYQAQLVDALTFPYRDAQIHVPPRYTAGATLKYALDKLSEHQLSPEMMHTEQGKTDVYGHYAHALYEAYQHRLMFESSADKSCTTNFNVVDKDGNMIVNTQTLLGVFGSAVTTDRGGFLLNNGMMWFDPVPGNANSIAEDTMCLSNMCSTLVETDKGLYGLSASGGRKIFPSVFQLLSFVVDFDMDIEQAFHTPRINCDGTKGIAVDPALANTVMERLAEKGYSPYYKRKVPYPHDYACPTGAFAGKDIKQGITEPTALWGDSVAG